MSDLDEAALALSQSRSGRMADRSHLMSQNPLGWQDGVSVQQLPHIHEESKYQVAPTYCRDDNAARILVADRH
jgi:hypothetical protein